MQRPTLSAPTVLVNNSLLLALSYAWRERLTPAGRYFFLPTFVFSAIGATSLEHHIHVACLYSLAFWLICIPFAIFDWPRVRLRVRHSDRVCAGELLDVEIDVEQIGSTPHADVTIVPHRLPVQLSYTETSAMTVALTKQGDHRHAQVALVCNNRGVFELPGWRAETDFPFGMMHPLKVFKQPSRLLVYPRYTPLGRLNIESGRRYHPGGVALASKLGESFEYLGNREYREGDNIRDMDWRATSRLNKPVIREYREEYFHRVAVVLDTFVPARAKPPLRDDFERAVSLSAAISDYMARQEYLVDLFAAGPSLYHLTAGRSLAYVDQILDILACVESSATQPFEAIGPEIKGYLAQITTIVCVMLDWDELRREFVHDMMQQGASVKVVIVRNSPCSVDPYATPDGFSFNIVDAQTFDNGVDEL